MKKKLLNAFIPALIVSIASSAVLANITMDERTIPTPVGISSEMANVIEKRVHPPVMPVPESTEAWLAFQSQFNMAGIELAQKGMDRLGVTYEAKSYAGVDTFFVTPKELSPEYQGKWLIHLHGGAFVFGGGESALREAAWIAGGLGAQVISIDYRKPPLHPFPAALEDTVAVWKELMKTQKPEATAIFGTSAGGNLTLATVLKLQQMGLPTPGAIYAGTPVTDLKLTSDSWYTMKGLDPLGQREGLIQATIDLYADGEGLANPLLSPIYAEIEDFPPTLFLTGTRDLLLSDTVRMHRLLRSADVETLLHVYDGQSHADYMAGLLADVPESDDAIREIGLFFNKHLK
ncbi:alpha/beta hydrolase [Photobacterium lutimaris]|uniref:Alpha/beta hydrolase n=1 Tax=Photobacterium lutimaris TaxID=388278 RepID=A0A2T3J0Q2_9GAMM|nr:alpha/beta hydrolase [Photobacterium lutimaris]PSU34620.1 alpha/beta hydrolase [Photobacterium lutimaris]TDR71535.1 acetyl esterase/lipase [Photobacterium lutimaris]